MSTCACTMDRPILAMIHPQYLHRLQSPLYTSSESSTVSAWFDVHFCTQIHSLYHYLYPWTICLGVDRINWKYFLVHFRIPSIPQRSTMRYLYIYPNHPSGLSLPSTMNPKKNMSFTTAPALPLWNIGYSWNDPLQKQLPLTSNWMSISSSEWLNRIMTSNRKTSQQKKWFIQLFNLPYSSPIPTNSPWEFQRKFVSLA